MFDIADVPFSHVSDKEKLDYHAKIIEHGSFQGYKLRQYWVNITGLCLATVFAEILLQHINGGVKDQIETYNSTHLI